MWSFRNPVNLIRYLIVWRVNRSLALLPHVPAPELSWVVGSIIAKRLSTQEGKKWQKSIRPLQEYFQKLLSKKNSRNNLVVKSVPEAGWPLNSVIFFYPGKRTYGRHELIFWELQLLGADADHGIFLEVILPAIEEASFTTDSPWHRQHSIWGRFDIHAIYAAHGNEWHPFVKAGELDLHYNPKPTQWFDGLELKIPGPKKIKQLTWLSPVNLTGTPVQLLPEDDTPPVFFLNKQQPPTLDMILKALFLRLFQILPGRRKKLSDVWDMLTAEEASLFQQALEVAEQVVIRRNDLKKEAMRFPGAWLGQQKFAPIPESVIRYLELAAILHIGKQTHFGCGTFHLAP